MAKNFPALSSKISNKANGLILFAGDSLTRSNGCGILQGPGSGSNFSGGACTNDLSYPSIVANLLAATGIQTRTDAFMTTGTVTTGSVQNMGALYSGRVSASANWVDTASNSTVGGRAISNSVDSGALSFTPAHASDIFDIYWAPGSTAQTISDSTGVLKSITTASTVGIKTRVTRPIASRDPILISNTGTGLLVVMGIVPFSSSRPAIQIVNGGSSGSTSSNWVSAATTVQPFAMIPLMAPDLHVFEIGINDASTAVPVATFQTNLNSYVTTLSSLCPIILAKSVKGRGTYQTGGDIPAAFLTAIDTVSALNNLAQNDIDFNALSALFTQQDYFDTLGPHLVYTGYAKKAALLANAILNGI